MAENKKSFLLYCDLIHTVSKMPDEKAGQLLKHILAYVNDLNPTTDDLIIQLTFEPIKQSLKRDLEKYERIKAKNTENALLRWNKNNATASDRIPLDAKNADSVNDSDSVSDKDSVNDILLKKETKKNILSDSNKKFNFRLELIEYGFLENLVDDWLLVRKNKKASNTETALKTFINEIESRECNINDMLQIAVSNSWSSFKHNWVDNLKNSTNGKQSNSNEPKIGRQPISTIEKNLQGWGNNNGN